MHDVLLDGPRDKIYMISPLALIDLYVHIHGQNSQLLHIKLYFFSLTSIFLSVGFSTKEISSSVNIV